MRRRLTNWLKNTLEFSHTEANGFLLLIIIILILLPLPWFIPFMFERKYDQFISDEKKLNELIASLNKDNTKIPTGAYHPNKKKAAFFPFNPNHVTLKQMDSLGVPIYVQRNILGYRNKGGKFKIKKDVLKIYGLDSLLFNKLAPYMMLPDSFPKPQKTLKSLHPKSKEFYIVDINLADTADLNALNGIGNTLSERILKYRKKLGGYIHLHQLKEVYGIDSLLYLKICKHLTINKEFEPIKIPINQASQEELMSHPYIRKKFGTILFNYRNHHGPFKNLEDLKKTKVADQETLYKLTPYLQF